MFLKCLTTLTATYTMTGLKRSEGNGSLTTLYAYDAIGRTTNVTTGTTVNTYNYDIGNNRTGFTSTVNSVQQFNTVYTYDALNRMAKMTQGTVTATYAYDANGNRQSVTYNNGLVESYTYNNANLVTTLANKNSAGTVLSQYSYVYNLAGNQTKKTDQSGNVYNYTYDGVGRLTTENDAVSGSTQGYAYTYDDNNNRSQLTATGAQAYTTGYTYDLNNRLLSTSKTVGTTITTTSYNYDPNGNQVSSISESVTTGTGTPSYALANGVAGSTTNRYNGLNQLMETNNNGTIAAYSYFATVLRASKTVGGVTTNFVLDRENVVLELQNGTVVAKYIRAINLVSSTIGGATNYYLFNAHGDVTQLTNASGTVTKSYDYDAFGNEKNPVTSETNLFRYCGEYQDDETGFVYLRARFYDPTIGRFLSEDTYRGKATDPLSLNLYTYCENNPIGFIDPSGHVIELSSKATKEEIEQYERAIEYLKTSETFAELYQMLIDSEEVFAIQFTTNHTTSFNFKTLKIKWDPTSGLVVPDGVQIGTV